MCTGKAKIKEAPRNMNKLCKKILGRNILGLLKKKEKPTDKNNVHEDDIPNQTRGPEQPQPYAAALMTKLNDEYNKTDLTLNDEPHSEDESDNESFVYLERKEKNDSQSSHDSGFSETIKDCQEPVNNETKDDKVSKTKTKNSINTESNINKTECNTDDLAENIGDLNLDGTKKRKTKVVPVARAPTRNCDQKHLNAYRPYSYDSDTTKQISRVNTQILSGGQVTVNSEANDINQINLIAQQLEKEGNDIINNQNRDSQSLYDDVFKVIDECITITNTVTEDEEFPDLTYLYNLNNANENLNINNANVDFQHDSVTEIYSPDDFSPSFVDEMTPGHLLTYPTPPRSVRMSPITDLVQSSTDMCFDNVPTCQTSLFIENTPSQCSSPMLSPINNEFSPYPESGSLSHEQFQIIPPYEDSVGTPDTNSSITTQNSPASCDTVTKKETLKQFKHVQADILAGFAKKDCCKKDLESCEKYFRQISSQMTPEARSRLLLGIANMDFKDSYKTLQKVLSSLAKGSKQEDLEIVIFSYLCRRVLTERPHEFLAEFGLRLLVFAVLRCYRLPILTRYLVENVRAAYRVAVETGHPTVDLKKPIFDQLNSHRDNLVSACALQLGDEGSDALYWLVRREPQQPPLFDVTEHANADGYSALHVACKHHSVTSPRLHTVHVLIVHGGYDLRKGSTTGGDTPLHVAVNSLTCDINLVLSLFKTVEQKEWKSLAHIQNWGFSTPIESARKAVKSSTPQNFPTQVLEFFKKCR